MAKTAPDAVTIPGLCLHRIRRADRYGHSISLAIEGPRVPALESVETCDEQCDWPPSPPLADWQYESRVGGSVLLAVGTAGRTHWSASIELWRNGGAQFDVAARVAGPPGFLGAQYRLLRPGATLVARDRLDLGSAWQLTCDAGTTRVRLDEPAGIAIIEPTLAAEDAWPQTIRWRYRIELAASAR